MGTARHVYTGESPSTVPDKWRRSSRCVTGSCIEVCHVGTGVIGLRDTKQSHLGDDRPVITLTTATYLTLLDEIAGTAPKGSNDEIDLVRQRDGDTVFRSRKTGVELRFDQDEIDAFVAGIKAGEFTPEALMQPVG